MHSVSLGSALRVLALIDPLDGS
jgi:hypothetical protein